MKTKEEIVKDWLPRYTGTELNDFGDYILLTNFINYVDNFAEKFNVNVIGRDRPMQTATANGLRIGEQTTVSPMTSGKASLYGLDFS